MKKVVLILMLAVSILSCNSSKENKEASRVDYFPDHSEIIQPERDTVFQTDTIRDTVQVIPDEYLLYALQIKNIKHYVSITKKRPENRKFFYGWIVRAVAE